jgi:hypothetical protein
MRPVRQVLAYPTASANSVALTQTPGGVGPITLNGALVVNGVAILSTATAPQVQLTLTSGGATGINFTITGTDYRGTVVSEVLTGPSTNTVTSVNSYATITSISASGASGASLTAGNAQSGSSPVVVLNQYSTPFNVSLTVIITGTVNVTVQYTNDPIFGSGSLDALNWFNDSSLTNQTSSQMASLISPVSACRQVFNSGSGTAAFTATQAGLI